MTAAELSALAERLESNARSYDDGGMPIHAEEQRAAARVVRAMAAVQTRQLSIEAFAFPTDTDNTVRWFVSPITGPDFIADTLIAAIEEAMRK